MRPRVATLRSLSFVGLIGFSLAMVSTTASGAFPSSSQDCTPSVDGCPIPFDELVSGAITDGSDAHLWLLSVEGSGDFFVELSDLPANYRLYVYGPDLSLLGVSDDDATSSKRLDVLGGDPGRYLVFVDSPVGETSDAPYWLLAGWIRMEPSAIEPTTDTPEGGAPLHEAPDTPPGDRSAGAPSPEPPAPEPPGDIAAPSPPPAQPPWSCAGPGSSWVAPTTISAGARVYFIADGFAPLSEVEVQVLGPEPIQPVTSAADALCQAVGMIQTAPGLAGGVYSLRARGTRYGGGSHEVTASFTIAAPLRAPAPTLPVSCTNPGVATATPPVVRPGGTVVFTASGFATSADVTVQLFGPGWSSPRRTLTASLGCQVSDVIPVGAGSPLGNYTLRASGLRYGGGTLVLTAAFTVVSE